MNTTCIEDVGETVLIGNVVPVGRSFSKAGWEKDARSNVKKGFASEPCPSSCTKALLNQPDLNQSQCIRAGNILEKGMRDLVNYSSIYNLLDPTSCKIRIGSQNKVLDIVARNHIDMMIMHREAKANLKLDTEKGPSVDDRVSNSIPYLRKRFPGYNIDACVLIPFYNEKHVEQAFKRRLDIRVKCRIEYMSDYIKRLGLPISYDDWVGHLHYYGHLVAQYND